MVSVKKLRKGDNSYYYLEHSVREGQKVYKKRVYLGKSIPLNVARLKADLIDRIYTESWYSEFDRIKKCYKKTLLKTPQIIKKKNLEAFMVKFTYDTQRIEGSRLSLPDTDSLLTQRIVPKTARLDDVKEAEKHKEVFYSMLKEKGDLSLKLVLLWHSRLFEETKPEFAGKIRKYPVMIGTSEFIPPKAERLKELLGDFFEWYGRNKGEINPVKLAALVHLKFVTIHPFGDGNGRASRMMMNFVLNRFGYPMIDIRYANRKGYYNALKRAQIERDDGIFVEWFFRRYIRENKEYLDC